MSTTPEYEMYFHRYSGGGLDMFEFEGDPYAAIGDTFKVTAVVELAKVVVDETKDGQRHILGLKVIASQPLRFHAKAEGKPDVNQTSIDDLADDPAEARHDLGDYNPDGRIEPTHDTGHDNPFTVVE